MPLVGVILGSSSDQPVIDDTVSVLNQMGIDHEVVVASAHRTPEKVREGATGARDRGIEVIIAAAGGSAGLPGVVASWTTLPIIGVPLTSSDLNGVDSLYAIAQMPPGIPVGCVAIGEWGSRNAGHMAAEIIGLFDDEVAAAVDAYRDRLHAG